MQKQDPKAICTQKEENASINNKWGTHLDSPSQKQCENSLFLIISLFHLNILYCTIYIHFQNTKHYQLSFQLFEECYFIDVVCQRIRCSILIRLFRLQNRLLGPSGKAELPRPTETRSGKLPIPGGVSAQCCCVRKIISNFPCLYFIYFFILFVFVF